LVEYAKTTQDELRRAVIEIFAKSSAVLDTLRFTDIQGGALQYNVEKALPGIGFRGVNEAYAESVGILNPAVEKLKIIGGDMDTDKFLIRTMGESRRTTDTKMKLKAAALYFTKIFFDGDESSDPRQIDGLNKRLTGNQVIEAGANGANLTENMLDRLIDGVEGGPTELYMSKKMRRQLNALAKANTLLSAGVDAWGRPIEKFAGIPIRIIERDNLDSEILDFDETQGSSNVTGSIYAVRNEEGYFEGIQSGPLEAYDLGELEAKPALRLRVEWYPGIAIFHPRAAARLKGITTASGVE
jgi:hypothetical protein